MYYSATRISYIVDHDTDKAVRDINIIMNDQFKFSSLRYNFNLCLLKNS
jgi:hypothetical protein